MKKIISILICIQIALFPAFAFAANVGGWTLGGGVAQGASTVYTGTKNIIINGKDYIKTGTAKITPPVSAVSKVLARGVAGYALSVAVEQLLGAVDWVLDPANNQIRYKEQPKDAPDPNYQYRCNAPQAKDVLFDSISQCGQQFLNDKNVFNGDLALSLDSCSFTWTAVCDFKFSWGVKGYVVADRVPRTAPIEEPEEKTLPLEVVAQKVISNAESDDTSAQVATTAAAADMVAEAEKDDAKARPIVQQLESSAQTKPADQAAADNAGTATGSQTQNPTKPDTTDLKLEFPLFCNWAPTVCQAAQVVISFPTTLTDWWNTTNQKADSWASSIADAWASVKEWATGEPDLKEDQTDLPIEEQTIDRDPSSFDTDYIVLGSQCPSFEPYTVEVGPISKTLSMDLSPLCDFAAQVRPAILGMSYLTAAGIVVAAIRET